MQMLVLAEKVPSGMEKITLDKITKYVMAFESEFDRIHIITSYDYSDFSKLNFHRARWHETSGKFPGARAHMLYFVNVFFSGISILRRNSSIGVVSNSWTHPTLGFLAVVLGKCMRRKSIVRVAGDIEVGAIIVERRYKTLSKLFKKILVKLEEFTFRHADLIVSVSESIFERHPWIRKKTFVIPDLFAVVEEYAGNASCLEKESFKTNEVKILYVGRLEPEKGVDILVESLGELVRSTKQKVQCRIVGDGSLRKEIEELVKKLGIEGKVIFTGYLPQKEVYELMCRSDVLVLPSYSEFTPNVIIEAMGIGVAVIASNVGGIKYIVKNEENGFTFERGSARELTKVLSRVAGDYKLRMKVCRTAKRYVSEEFSHDKIKSAARRALQSCIFN